ncbi:TPA: hypothetical protein TUY09_001829, partial [Streptococcus equi subsp. zooepidemicus]|nr:hypothetical protein [Streptococcus equi subsp. zooepidemicus]HEL0717447.1 hypothetical protein [Streptococcus equi subsp. zooepidemicus]
LGCSEQDAQRATLVGNILGGFAASNAARRFSLNEPIAARVTKPTYKRQQLLKNLESSRLARESSRFKNYVAREKLINTLRKQNDDLNLITFREKAIEIFNRDLKGNSWVSIRQADEFVETLDDYAQLSVDNGAVSTKADFYKMYSNKNYIYLDGFIKNIKQLYIKTGASSIVNGQDLYNAIEQYGTIGRGKSGNFATSMAEDIALLYDSSGNLVSSGMIEAIKGVDEGKYLSGAFQYEYSPQLVKSFDQIGEVRTVTGKTPGSSLLNIPGAKTWAGKNMALSQSELMMPSIDTSNLKLEDVLLSMESTGIYTLNNPTIVLKDGTKKIVEGQFIIRKLGN